MSSSRRWQALVHLSRSGICASTNSQRRKVVQAGAVRNPQAAPKSAGSAETRRQRLRQCSWAEAEAGQHLRDHHGEKKTRPGMPIQVFPVDVGDEEIGEPHRATWREQRGCPSRSRIPLAWDREEERPQGCVVVSRWSLWAKKGDAATLRCARAARASARDMQSGQGPR